MKTMNVSSTFIIPANQNIKYLYNHLNDAVKKNQTSAIFAIDRVEISTVTKEQKEGILHKLKELQAIFTVK